jgi:hypothetical protein
VTPQGFGLFVTGNAANLGSEYTNLGTDPLATWTQQALNRWRSALALPNTLAASNLRGCLWETLTFQADPIGDDRALPLVPVSGQRRYELWLAGQLVHGKPFRLADPEATPLLDLLKRHYRSLRQCSLDGLCSPTLYRKWLGYQVRKYAIGYRNFQPADVPDEPPLEPTTTITDNFNRADADALGSGSEGWSWTEVTGDHDIVSNQVGPGSGGGRARAESDLSSDDHYAQLTMVDGSLSGQGSGPTVRYAAAADTCYLALSDGARIFKCESGSLTNLTSAIGDPANGSVLKREADGSSLELFDDGVSIIGPITDTSITGNVRTGFYRDFNRTLDNFEAADLATGVTYSETGSGGLILGGSSGITCQYAPPPSRPAAQFSPARRRRKASKANQDQAPSLSLVRPTIRPLTLLRRMAGRLLAATPC